MRYTRPGGPKTFVIACSAAGILALSPTLASAQQENGEAANPPSAQQAPPQKAQPAPAERKAAPPATNSRPQSQPRASSEPAPGKSDGNANATRNRSKQADQARSKEQSQQKRAADGDDNKPSRSQKRSTAQTGKDDRKDEARKNAQRNENSTKSGTSAKEPEGKAQAQSKDGVNATPGAPAAKNAEQQRTPGTPQSPQTKTGEASGNNAARPARLDDTQRVEVRRAIFASSDVRRVNRPNFTVSIGTRIPRTVQLAVIPATLIAIVPAYRAYRYVVVDDRICIVEPNTYEIVEVIEESGAGPGLGKRDQVAVLELNTDQRRSVAVLARQGAPRADIRISLALGAEIPTGVMMFEFPADIVANIARLRDYRYVLVDDKVVVADPRTRVIVLVVDN